MVYLIIGSILIGLIIVLFYLLNKCHKKSPPDKDSDSPPDTESPYEGLRRMAFNTTPDQLGLVLTEGETEIYGLIMDWGMGKAVATTVCYRNGEASVYFSTGGGIVGGRSHKEVSKAVQKWIRLAPIYLLKATLVTEYPLAGEDVIKFYFLTNTGIYTAQENMTAIRDHTSIWRAFFDEANNVISQLRLISQQQYQQSGPSGKGN